MQRLGEQVGTIRFRITALATVVVAVVLTLMAAALVLLVRRELLLNLDSSLEQRADAYETSFAGEGLVGLSVLLNSNDEDRAAQLVDPTGAVVASTPNLADGSAFDDSARLQGQTFVRSVSIAALEDDSYRLLSRDAETASGSAVLHVAQNIDDLDDTIRNLTIALAMVVPIVVTILASLVWLLVGRTLRPVERMRSEVADISGNDLSRRLAVSAHTDEIARLAETMNELLDRIDHSGRRQRRFVADAAHELRTPLTRMRTELEVDLNRPDLADLAATHATVLEEAIAVQELLDNLLFLARSDEQQRSPSRQEAIDFDDIVLREAGHHRIDSPVSLDTSAVSAVQLIGDAGQLARVVRNLLGNAVRHAQSTVTIMLSETDDRVRLTVTDDGPGVPAEFADRIFERFGRADDARSRDDGGTGLGLAIVRDIARLHGGDVRYDQSWSGGARFIVDLPNSRPERQSLIETPTAARRHDRSCSRIVGSLIVESRASIRTLETFCVMIVQ